MAVVRIFQLQSLRHAISPYSDFWRHIRRAHYCGHLKRFAARHSGFQQNRTQAWRRSRQEELGKENSKKLSVVCESKASNSDMS